MLQKNNFETRFSHKSLFLQSPHVHPYCMLLATTTWQQCMEEEFWDSYLQIPSPRVMQPITAQGTPVRNGAMSSWWGIAVRLNSDLQQIRGLQIAPSHPISFYFSSWLSQSGGSGTVQRGEVDAEAIYDVLLISFQEWIHVSACIHMPTSMKLSFSPAISVVWVEYLLCFIQPLAAFPSPSPYGV